METFCSLGTAYILKPEPHLDYFSNNYDYEEGKMHITV